MATSDHTSQGTPPSTLSASPMVIAPINVSPPERFNFSTPAAWPAWRKRLERYMSVSGQLQKSEKEKIDILLYIMGEEAEEIILQLEKEPANFQEALTSLDKFFIPRRNIIYERYKFNLRVQKPGESVDAFITSLHSLAEHCNYGTLKEELIRDRIVAAERQLKETLTLQQCVLEAKQAELQASHSKELNSHQQVSRVQEYRSNPASSAGDNKANRNPALRRGKLPSRCSFCGLQPHRREQCPASKSNCRKCQKKGHWASVCKKINVDSVYVDNIVELESKYNTAHYDSSDCEGEEVSDKFLGPISVVYGVNHVSSKEWVVSVFVTKLEKSLDFLVDSGADISCIPKCFIDNKLKSKIKPSKNIVTGPSGVKLSLLGTLNVDLKYKNQTCNTEIYVIDNLTKPILGRTSILELNVLGDYVWVTDLRVYAKIIDILEEPCSFLIESNSGCTYRRNRWHLIPAPYYVKPRKFTPALVSSEISDPSDYSSFKNVDVSVNGDTPKTLGESFSEQSKSVSDPESDNPEISESVPDQTSEQVVLSSRDRLKAPDELISQRPKRVCKKPSYLKDYV
nr:unnamed protein product [Callosobruchus analis]